jgi:hypothetical protein
MKKVNDPANNNVTKESSGRDLLMINNTFRFFHNH